MKFLRFWFVVLIAALLPLRGAVGAAMLCPMGSPAGAATLAQLHDADDVPAQATASHQHGDRHQHAGADDDGRHDHQSEHDKCKLCVAFCSVTPMASDPPKFPAPLALGTVTFPDCADAAPSFVPDGEKRPPRSI